MNQRMLLAVIPLAFFFILVVILYKGLGRDATELESALIDQAVPEFTLEDLSQPEHFYDASLFQGEPLLLNVWATWCPTCRREHAFLNQLASQGIKIIGLNYKDDRVKAGQWLVQLGNPYRVNLFDERGMLGIDLGVYGAPETYFIDSHGVIRYRHVGDINSDNWEGELLAIFKGMK